MAYGVHSKKFLCCLPVRLGVFVLSILQTLLYAFLAFLFWFALIDKDVHIDSAEKVTAVIDAVHSTLMVIVCLCGFIGAIRRSRTLVSYYSQTLQVLLFISFVFSISWAITWLKKSRDDIIKQCIGDSTDQSTIDACHNVNTVRYVALGFLIFVLLVHLYQCIIIDRYVRQLEEEDNEKFRLRSFKSSAYEEAAGRGSTDALANPHEAAVYPYSDSNNSYGSSSKV